MSHCQFVCPSSVFVSVSGVKIVRFGIDFDFDFACIWCVTASEPTRELPLEPAYGHVDWRWLWLRLELWLWLYLPTGYGDGYGYVRVCLLVLNIWKQLRCSCHSQLLFLLLQLLLLLLLQLLRSQKSYRSSFCCHVEVSCCNVSAAACRARCQLPMVKGKRWKTEEKQAKLSHENSLTVRWHFSISRCVPVVLQET